MKKMTPTQLKQYVIAEAKKLVKEGFDQASDRGFHGTPPSNDGELDFEEELSIVRHNLFSPEVEAFMLRKKSENPGGDWGDLDDWDNLDNLIVDDHNRSVMNITDDEILSLAGDIRDNISRKQFDKMFNNPMGQLDDLSASLRPKNESKMTTTQLKQYVIAEAKKLVKVEMLKEEKKRIVGQLKKLNEGEADIHNPEEIMSVVVDFAYRNNIITFISSIAPGVPIIDLKNIARLEPELSSRLSEKFPEIFNKEYFYENINLLLEMTEPLVSHWMYGEEGSSVPGSMYYEEALEGALKNGKKYVVLQYMS